MYKGNKCRYSMCTCTLTPFCRTSFVRVLGEKNNVLAPEIKLYTAIRSSRVTGKIVKLLGFWPLTERHIHFCVNLWHFCGRVLALALFLSLSLFLSLPLSLLRLILDVYARRFLARIYTFRDDVLPIHALFVQLFVGLSTRDP